VKTKLLLVSALLLVTAVLAWRLFYTPDRLLRGRALDRREVALRVLGEHLAGQAEGQTALIVANPFSQMPGQARAVYAFDEAAPRGLTAGWGDRVRSAGVAYPELTPAAKQDPSSVPLPPDATTPLSFLTVERAWDALAQRHPDATLFVSVIGLPAEVQALECWRRPSPRFALLLPDLRLVGDAIAVAAAFKSGKIIAAVLNRPGAPTESVAMQRDFRAEFEARFLLVTATNIDDLIQVFPNLF
jgi:hypothetical protein